MNNRLIIALLLCAGALAFACGPRSRSEPSSLAQTASLQPERLTAKPASRSSRSAKTSAKTTSKIKSDLKVSVADREVRFALNVTNVGPKHVELSFPSGKAYDFVVVDSIGREVWHWSNGRMFTQGIRNTQLDKGDAMQVDEAWKNTAPSGRYTAIATLNSSNYPVEQHVDFVIP